MTGPEHYVEAERVLALARDARSVEETAALHANAQVHATLALVAAQADPDRVMVTHATAWRAVLL